LIVVSGVLVLVALVFLIIGLFGDGLGLIWASIITSVVAGVFLLLGALQRRGTPAATADAGPSSPEMLERVTAVSVRPRGEAAGDAPAEDAAEADSTGGAQVAIVPGRPRYHVPGCRFLAGRPDVETVSLEEAKSRDYSACGVCKPDQNATAAPASPAMDEAPVDEPVEDTVPTDMPEEEAPAEEAPILAAPTRAARKAPAKKAAATASTATKATAAKAAAAKAAKPAAKSTAGTSTVVAVPDRGKYHTETCRFANAPGALSMSKTAAKRQGLAACGVCKP
jgi:hypothetical protein